MSREYSDERSVLVPVVVSEWSDQFGLAQATAGFLAGYGDVTRRAYALDLKQRTRWCSKNDLDVLEVRRAHIELFARSMEEEGRARSTVARRLSTIAGFYRYCVEEQLIASSPAAHVRRPRIDYESRAVGLDRNELGMFLVQAGLSGGRDHALACLLALNGLRVSEALNSNIENLGLQRGHHRTLTITRKGGKIVTVPLAPRTARTVDLCVGERVERTNTHQPRRHSTYGPPHCNPDRQTARQTGGIAKNISPHSLRHSIITAALDAGVALRDVQEAASHADPRTTMRYDRARQSLDRHATYIVATFVAGASR
jgi:site-specific recombinase XerD